MLRCEEFIAPFAVATFGPGWDGTLTLGQRIYCFFEEHELAAEDLKDLTIIPLVSDGNTPYGLCVIIYDDKEESEQ